MDGALSSDLALAADSGVSRCSRLLQATESTWGAQGITSLTQSVIRDLGMGVTGRIGSKGFRAKNGV